MVVVNAHNEVADFLDVNQFIPGRSAYECVTYVGGLMKYMGQPGHGPSGTVLQASNLAQYWYGKEEGSNLASNQNGMSLNALYNMLQGMGLSYHIAPPTMAYVKAWLGVGYPVMLCGAETGMFDMALGDIVPYSWTPSGNHCIVVSGVAPAGNLLVHDCASIAPTGVRPGPRTYDASKMSLVSVTAIAVPWLPALPSDFDPTKEIDMPIVIDITNPAIAAHFKELNIHQWQCTDAGGPWQGKIIQYAMLSNYKTEGNAGLCGYDVLGRPMGNEIEIGTNDVIQFYEYGVRQWKASVVRPVALYDNGIGTDPAIRQLQAIIAQLKQAPVPPPLPTGVPPALIADVQAILDKAAAGKY